MIRSIVARGIAIVVCFSLIGLFSPLTGWSEAIDQPNFHAVLRTYAGQLAAVASESQAKTLFSTQLVHALDLKETFSTSASKIESRGSASVAAQNGALPDVNTLVVRLTMDLATWRAALAMKQAADSGDTRQIQALLEQIEPQREWLLTEKEHVSLRRALNLAVVLTSFHIPNPMPPDPSSRYVEYAGFLDRMFPRFTGADDSWLPLAEEGVSGVHQRLLRVWEHSETPAPENPDPSNENQRDALAAQYFHTRLRPVLIADLIAQAVRTETWAEQRARATWLTLRIWQEKRREIKGLARLCGTWLWTIHNHQNHQDIKTTMVFSPPDAVTTAKVRPVKMTVLGDSVYLRWEFQGGVQEDSLLFTGEEQRLEGNFTNSSGAWGSITGKRVGACGK